MEYLQKPADLIIENERLKSEIQGIKVSMIEAETEQDLKHLEVGDTFQRRRIITDECEFLIMGDPKPLVEIINTMESYTKQKQENDPIKRIFILEELLVFANGEGVEKMMMGSIPSYVCSAVKSSEAEIKLRGLTLAARMCDRYEKTVDLLNEQNCIGKIIDSLNSENQLIKYAAMRAIRIISKYDKKINILKKHNLVKTLATALRDGNNF
eukprot:TRINITY_DN15328_c0_g3_i1.p1 TRINITY_DN15328_c0_g3~~TRINITY_DN15328_c0_g3_i1.p1  ORF type:complete len:211 (-),score=50.55 TRINITY_DN15328_c0_g3_i1:948-1580(-)